MTTSQNHKYTQLKWLYSALSGLCAAYFLALFSSGTSLESSVLLQLTTLCFAICLPVFTTFAFAHVYIHELDVSVELCDEALKEPWVKQITIGSFGCLLWAFILLIGFFSITAMIGFLVVSALCVYCFIEFVAKLNSKCSEN